MIPTRIKNLWSGDWPYDSGAGIGLKLTGYPTDVDKFQFILAVEGCHPTASQRILNRISEVGFDNLTVMSHLNFEWLKNQLDELSVDMQIIAPQENWESLYPSEPFSRELLETIHTYRHENNLH